MEKGSELSSPEASTSETPPAQPGPERQPASTDPKPPLNQLKSSYKPRRKWLISGLTAFVIITLGIAGYFTYQNYQLKKEQTNLTQPTPAPIYPSPTAGPTADWKIYENSILGIKFKYPQNLVISKNNFSSETEYTVIDTQIQTVGQGSAIIAPIEFSFDLNGNELATAIEQAKSEFTPESLLVNTVTSQGGIQITTISGTRISGWQGGEKMSKALFISKDNKTIVFNYFGYIKNKESEISESSFSQILSTLQFTNQESTYTCNLIQSDCQKLENYQDSDWNINKTEVIPGYENSPIERFELSKKIASFNVLYSLVASKEEKKIISRLPQPIIINNVLQEAQKDNLLISLLDAGKPLDAEIIDRKLLPWEEGGVRKGADYFDFVVEFSAGEDSFGFVCIKSYLIQFTESGEILKREVTKPYCPGPL